MPPIQQRNDRTETKLFSVRARYLLLPVGQRRAGCQITLREAMRALSLDDSSKFSTSIRTRYRVVSAIPQVTDHHREGLGQKEEEAAGGDENSRYALENAEEDGGKKRSRGRGTKRGETPVNTSGGLAPGKKLPGSRCRQPPCRDTA